MTKPNSTFPQLSFWRIFPTIFVAIFLLHAPLLRLPFFWDEAGFYVPAAYDLAHFHTLIPRTTMDTGHPPLSAAYLALWFTLSGWKPAVARIAMLLLAAFALSNVFLLAKRLTRTGVAVATTIATAIYPIFFVQSSLTHADLAAAAFTLWGIRLYVERRIWPAQLAFSLAVLSKETAIITPLAVMLWELLPSRSPIPDRQPILSAKNAERMGPATAARSGSPGSPIPDRAKAARFGSPGSPIPDRAKAARSGSPGSGPARGRFARAAISLVPLAPLFAWLLYHHHVTGRFFGGADFYQYNVTQALNPLRFLLALVQRIWHLFGIMNMLALTAATLVAMFFAPVKDASGERPRIDLRVQLLFALIMLAHLITFSLLGGALLTRYLLPAYPLVILLGMSTLHRRIARWEWPAALMVIVFVLALFFDPPYRFAPEDNLRYRDFVELHYRAAQFLQQHEQGNTVLSAWPATDELTRPYLGYVRQPFQVLTIHDFSVEELFKARQMRSRYQVAYLFSTKYEATPPLRSDTWEKLHRRFFDYHRDVQPELAAEFLHGNIVFLARSHAEWVAIIEMEQPSPVASSAYPSQ